MLHLNGQRSVLQRRSNISNALQALLDGTAVLGIAYWLIDRHLGFVSAPYTFMVVLLLGMLGLLYDQLALYRSNANFTTKALKIFQAWTLAFAMLLALGFLTKQTETFSRLLVGQLYVLGFFAQLLLHLLLRVLQRQLLISIQN
ncbi:hypothetical protein [Hydrogenophaga defluvii]|uniref:Undecaprenyl-phosphate glucose phosphotransferase n=1 Tax=Hydrogenophaga defluvii TaxID=249410 RepID=A0ABW2SGG3_9BURK